MRREELVAALEGLCSWRQHEQVEVVFRASRGRCAGRIRRQRWKPSVAGQPATRAEYNACARDPDDEESRTPCR